MFWSPLQVEEVYTVKFQKFQTGIDLILSIIMKGISGHFATDGVSESCLKI